VDVGLLILRIVVGSLLVGHGCRKLLGWFGGGGLVGTAWYFRSVGYRPPRAMAALAGGAELVGGAAGAGRRIGDARQPGGDAVGRSIPEAADTQGPGPLKTVKVDKREQYL
jgi:hypothetical protein